VVTFDPRRSELQSMADWEWEFNPWPNETQGFWSLGENDKGEGFVKGK
jgi:hypothetical protein